MSVPRMSKTVPVLSPHLFDWTKNSSVLPSQDNVTVTIDNPCLPMVHTACLCHSLLITPTVPEYRSFYCIQWFWCQTPSLVWFPKSLWLRTEERVWERPLAFNWPSSGVMSHFHSCPYFPAQVTWPPENTDGVESMSLGREKSIPILLNMSSLSKQCH